MMSNATKRWIPRLIHLIFSIPIVGYVYSPFAELPNYAPVVRFVSIPVLVLTGFWMWKGHVLRRLISKSLAQQDAADNPSRLGPPSLEMGHSHANAIVGLTRGV